MLNKLMNKLITSFDVKNIQDHNATARYSSLK